MELAGWILPAIRDAKAGTSLLASLRSLSPWLALAWGLGAAAMLARLGGGLWWMERHLVAPSKPAPAAWQATVRRLADRLGAGQGIRIRVSLAADSPLVIGWLRPVILVPAGAFLHLAPEALEAVLAHEIAHVRRADFLANLLQSVAEALLFFHPAAWWLSRHVRDLREHCCDDIAADVCGDPMLLAEGLAALERLRRTPSTVFDQAAGPALGAAKGNLMFRISRLFRPQDAFVPSFRGLALVLSGALLVAAGTLAAQGAPAKKAPKPAPKAEAKAETDAVVDQDFSQIKVKFQPAAPAYPADAKEKRIQGTVVVVVTIDTKGVPVKVEAIEGPEELRPTAVDYAKGWLFEPAKVKGKAVSARFKLTMPFKLR